MLTTSRTRTRNASPFQNLENAAEYAADAVALAEQDSTVTYADLLSRVRTFAAAIARVGARPGDRVAIFLDKTVDSVAALYAGWHSGLVVVPINDSLRQRQIDHILLDSGSRCLVSSSRLLARAGVTAPDRVDLILAESLTGSAPPAAADPAPGDTHDPAALLYTSGSTGKPKGILLSNANLAAGTRIVSNYLHLRADDTILSVLPFSFDYGLNQLLTSVANRSRLVLQRSMRVPDVCTALQTHEVTGLAGVPPFWSQLCGNDSPFWSIELPALRYVTNSGGIFPKELLERFRERKPRTSVYLMYGLTEAFRSTYLEPEEASGRPGSIGKPIPETEIYILDSNGTECEPGQIGELVHRGPTVALGYWNDPTATNRVFRTNPSITQSNSETLVYSGDLARKDEEGYIYFIGRTDTMIKSLGYRISPDEVEEYLRDSQLIAEVAVTPIADEIAGTAIVAHIVPRDPASFSEQELRAFCRRELPRYAIPKFFRIHETLPRTPSGKIDRKSLE